MAGSGLVDFTPFLHMGLTGGKTDGVFVTVHDTGCGQGGALGSGWCGCWGGRGGGRGGGGRRGVGDAGRPVLAGGAEVVEDVLGLGVNQV